MGAKPCRASYFEFTEDAEHRITGVVFFQDTFRRDRLLANRLRMTLRTMLEDVLFDKSVALGLRVEELQLGLPRADRVKEVYDAYDRIAQAMGPQEAGRFHDAFLRIQRRFGADGATEVPFLGNGMGGLSQHLHPLFEEVGQRLLQQRAHSDYRSRIRQRERIGLALTLVEAQVRQDVAAGRTTEKRFQDFCEARDVHQGLRSLMPKRILAQLDREISETYIAQGMEPVALTVVRQGRIDLSPDGVVVFEELLVAALRRPQLLPSVAAERRGQRAA